MSRNGCGKSTVLKALADRLIPGISPSLRIHIVSQVEESSLGIGDVESTTGSGISSDQSALQRVLDGHVERTKALRERTSKLDRSISASGEALELADITVLEEIIDSEPSKAQRLMNQLTLQKRNQELEEARRVALLRSGARGWDARSEEIKAEKELEKAEEKWVCL
jgi:ATP-binding cassette subfamily F protein 3